MFQSFEEGLIAEVRKHEFVYNLSSPNYYNLLLKERMWQNISYRLNIRDENCRKKWKNLQKNYKRNKKELELISGPAAEEANSTFKHFKELSILDYDDPTTKVETENDYDGLPLLLSERENDDDVEEPEAAPSGVSSPIKVETENDDDVEEPETASSGVSSPLPAPPPEPEEIPKEIQDQLSKLLDGALLCIEEMRLAMEEDRVERSSSSTEQLMKALALRIELSGLSESEISQLVLETTNFVLSKLAAMKKRSHTENGPKV